ncbi:MAG TPA: sigma-54-dependent Fis family transcriptional regulator [Candidatus Latescibacteria bacterium]|nr:sigma-54-dependent Fis family transcriptional regulator [Candidatus Latescibacterota bacterium]
MSQRPLVLVVDGDRDTLKAYVQVLSQLGWELLAATDREEALARLSEARPDVVLTELHLPDKDGIALIRELRRMDPELPVVAIATSVSIPLAVQAIREGAFECIPKPLTSERLRLVLEQALERRRSAGESRQPEEGFDGIVGKSPEICKVIEMIRKVAETEANVLIVGESGTGKELVARSLHRRSMRADKPFVPVDCASIPEHLLESELFGHEKGAFTNAHISRPGLFEYADGGTLFLDEVSQLSLPLQAKLLRVLQERQFRRVGGRKLISVDIRVLSATNRDLKREVVEGRFREDLYYRLNVITIALPPLREREGDIPLLADHFLQKFSTVNNKLVKGISDETMEMLKRYPWPGNVRELHNVIEHSVLLAEGEVITPDDLPSEVRGLEASCPVREDLPYREAKKAWMHRFEREYFLALLRRHNGNISQAARTAGVSRKTIQRFLKAYRSRP